MSIKRILAAAAASVVAVSAMAVVASAADFTGTIDIAKGDGWTDVKIVDENKTTADEIKKLIGDADPATVDKITFTTDSADFIVCYNGTATDWVQDDTAFAQEQVVNGADIDWAKDGLCVKVCHNGAFDPVTISWTVTFKEADAAPETPADTTPSESAPADTNTGASNVDTGVEGVAVVVGVAAVAAGALIVAKKRK